MEPPATVSVESKPKPEQTNDSKPNNPKSYECGLCDTEVVYKIAQELLPGLASACVDNTTGGLFKNAGSVAVDMRQEMSDYLLQRSETYVAEFLLSESTPVLETSEHPYDIIITLIDDFTASKRNMLSRVSEWVFSDGREDKIDDFVQEMEVNGFWLLPRRESIASILLRNVDYKNSFHCNTVCGSEEEVVKHRAECKFRAMDCLNEGCTTRYCAAQKENHDAVCPFLILPCEQKCPDFVMRREMDRHCVTVCPMKLVNCAFYTVGCKSCIPRSNVQQHNVDDLSAHLLFIIRTARKEANEDELKQRVEQIRSLTNTEKLARARDARALTYLIKDAEAKLGPLPSTDSPTYHDAISKADPPTETEPLIVKDGSTKTELPIVKDGSTKTEPPIVKDGSTKTEPSTVKDGSTKTESLIVKDGSTNTEPSTVKDGSTKTDSSIVKDGSTNTEPSTVKDGSTKTEPSIVKDGSTKTEPSIAKDDPTKTEPSIVKDGPDTDSKPPPTKKEDNPVSPPPANDMKPSTEKQPAMQEVHQEPPKPVESTTDSLVKIDESKDKHESSPSPMIVKEEKNSEPPLKKEVPTDLKEDKGKPPEGEKLQEPIQDKNKQLSSNDEKDNNTKKSPEKGATEEPAKSPAP